MKSVNLAMSMTKVFKC